MIAFNDANANDLLDLGESLGTFTVAGGTWSITTGALADATYNIKAVQRDTAGNTSGHRPLDR